MSYGPNAKLSEAINGLQRKISKLDRMMATIGTGRDTNDFRTRLRREVDGVNRSCKSIIGDIKSTNQGRFSRGEAQVFSNLKEQFAQEFQKVQDVTKRIQGKDTAIIDMHQRGEQSGMNGGNDLNQGLLGARQEQAQAQDSAIDAQFLEFREDEINQRHLAIRDLERDAREVLDMFTDLSTLVDHQQEGLDIIENNVNEAATHVKEGNQELLQAEIQQGKSRKKTCWVIMILILILAVVVVIFTVL